ncbi:MAG: response regulator transcription factor [Caldilineaceae bacterium]|nr:response regulator transcription factor [Caldilineaceae bacterium]
MMSSSPLPPTSDGTAKHRVHILVVEDELTLQKLLHTSLERQGHTVTIAGTGADALTQVRAQPIELVLLDILLPDMSGFDVCREIRGFSHVPIVMLTSLNRPDDIVQGFDLGADDYITKPFRIREVQVRIEAIMRRMQWRETYQNTDHLHASGVSVNERAQEVRVRGAVVYLTPIEYRLLRYLMERANRPVSKKELFEQVWGYDLAGGTNLVEVAVRRLRNKIEEAPSHPLIIVTVHAIGYKFVSESSGRPTG